MPHAQRHVPSVRGLAQGLDAHLQAEGGMKFADTSTADRQWNTGLSETRRRRGGVHVQDQHCSLCAARRNRKPLIMGVSQSEASLAEELAPDNQVEFFCNSIDYCHSVRTEIQEFKLV